ncbi:MAG: alpha/beta fold hydrolase [Emcibacteraceae bacterium]|nr:alpha/beta fold hydrolase [Emcibacteraceae bacterium]MDG1858928.1 alpha/beta fold hydrolase [Emcibacteraceae bacterium]
MIARFLLIFLFSFNGTQAFETYSLGQCPLENGEVIEDCHITYQTMGTLNKDKSNIMIVPSWLGGTAQSFIDYEYAGSAKMINSDDYYVILMDAFASGTSSSPSNSKTQTGEEFPTVTIADMVKAQHRLLTEHLKVGHVSAFIGVSLGASQTYEWMSSYPDFMDKAVIITGTPQPTTSDRLSYNLAIDAVTGLLKLNDGGTAARNFVTRFETHMGRTSEWLANNIPTNEYDTFEQDTLNTTTNPYDYKTQTTALLNGDITIKDGGDLAKTAARLTTPFLTLSHPYDGYINPAPSIKLAELTNNSHIPLAGTCGHYAPDCEMEELTKVVHQYLKSN